MPALTLRPYQQDALDAVFTARAQGIRRPLVVLPTGAGKTVVCAALAQQMPGRTLMLVHRDELVRQSVEKFGWVADPAEIGIVQGSTVALDKRIVVASIATLKQPANLARLAAHPFDLVIHDEAHHAVAASSRAILQALRVWPDSHPHTLLLGVTATPMRADNVGLGAVFEQVVYRLSIATLIQQGYLADVKSWRVQSQVDLSRMAASGEDFNAQTLATAIDTPARNQVVVDAYAQYGEQQPTVVFSVTIAHAQHLTDAFQNAGYSAGWIAGSMPLAQRHAVLQAFHTGALQVLVNCAVLTEGWDEPRVGCLLLARPTQSVGLFTQMVGRGLRPYPGKAYCVVVDVADNAHNLVTVGSLMGEDLEALATPSVSLPPGDRQEPEDADPAVAWRLIGAMAWDALGRSQFVWHPSRTRMVLEAGPGQEIVLAATEDGSTDRWSVTWRHGRESESLTDQPLPLTYAQGVAEDWVRAHHLTAYAAKDAAWRSRPATPKQREMLQSLSQPTPEELTREEASQAIGAALKQQALHNPHAAWRQDPATPKQIAWLRAHHIPVPADLTKGQFSDILERFKHHGQTLASRS